MGLTPDRVVTDKYRPGLWRHLTSAFDVVSERVSLWSSSRASFDDFRLGLTVEDLIIGSNSFGVDVRVGDIGHSSSLSANESFWHFCNFSLHPYRRNRFGKHTCFFFIISLPWNIVEALPRGGQLKDYHDNKYEGCWRPSHTLRLDINKLISHNPNYSGVHQRLILLRKIRKTIIGIKTWIGNDTHAKQWDVITHPFPNVVYVEGCGWVITSHTEQYVGLLIHSLGLVSLCQ